MSRSSVLRSVISFREEKTSKDRMYNEVIQVLKSSKVGFTPMQIYTTGKQVVTTLTSVFWFLDGRYSRFESRGVVFPDIFKENLSGFRNYKEQHKKIPEVPIIILKYINMIVNSLSLDLKIFKTILGSFSCLKLLTKSLATHHRVFELS